MKSITIALATAKEAIRQPAFFVMAFFAGALLIITIFVSYFTFGEDIKMYKDTGLTTISFFCMLLALLTASSTVADEIEGKTAITLLSKPITRRQFIVGKFLGIELGVLALYALLGALFAAGVWYKFAYDIREAGGVVDSAKRWDQVMQMLPGLALGFFEVTILTGISVAISTRLPMLANLVVCILVFFLGHLTPVLVDVSDQTHVNAGERWRHSCCRGSSFSMLGHRSRPVRSYLGLAMYCLHSSTACCTVEQRCCWPLSSSRTVTWPEEGECAHASRGVSSGTKTFDNPQ